MYCFLLKYGNFSVNNQQYGTSKVGSAVFINQNICHYFQLNLSPMVSPNPKGCS